MKPPSGGKGGAAAPTPFVLVVGERRGRWTYYRVAPDALAGIAAVLAPVAA